jgi:ppGpp synthetase/RelA/SpoT-type nucleotidyltranferase
MHFVIQIPERVLELEGVPVPKHVRTGEEGFKAEVQVRTMLEHVWATTLHDRLYKAGIQVPAALKREAASLAATVEKAD